MKQCILGFCTMCLRCPMCRPLTSMSELGAEASSLANREVQAPRMSVGCAGSSAYSYTLGA